MTTLNKRASEVVAAHGVHAMTDMTGFGLMGHGREMAMAAAYLEIEGEKVPLIEGALDAVDRRYSRGTARESRIR